ncbi:MULTISPECIES: hypothetical protein [unclassified Haloferax]|jgi:hypothetical protein|uniref:hypothetical protein n=1 Tax=unclassified Haloferax TaxID=2625095 RepID=UPI0028745AA3|nr:MULTISPECIES: hypothetical protein [unclassified Haloferax]MDS0243118.1 hypothetical protein [Haloferax sp. S2CR25]MDS0446239.1 hypothetical protein [Haloferax sp. S2CR25-2]
MSKADEIQPLPEKALHLVDDTYAIQIQPPRSDGHYCRWEANGAAVVCGNDGSGKPTSRDDLIDQLRTLLEDWKDAHQSGTSSRDAPPTPSNTTVYAHEDYREDFTFREIFGDATLAQFGIENNSTFEDTSWAETKPEYDEWVAPLYDVPGERVLVLMHYDRGHRTWWVRATEDWTLERVAYEDVGHNWSEPEQQDITKLVRQLGGYGLIYTEPREVEFRGVKDTPFDEDYNHEYLDNHPEEVAGWQFTTDAPMRSDSWITPDGRAVVQVYGGGGQDARVEVVDPRLSLDLSSAQKVVPDDSPEPRADSDLTRDEARDTAVEWMNAHPADEFEHPLAEVGDVWDAFEIPDGYSARKIRERKGTISLKLTEEDPDGVEKRFFRVEGEFDSNGYSIVRKTRPHRGGTRPASFEECEYDLPEDATLVDALVRLQQIIIERETAAIGVGDFDSFFAEEVA